MDVNYKLINMVIENVKNVEYGEISFLDNNEPLNMLGIYGQNGSGKTTVIECVNLLKNLVMGEKNIPLDLLSTTQESRISTTFQIDRKRTITYEIVIKKNPQDSFLLNMEKASTEKNIKVISEKLTTKELSKNSRERELIKYEQDEKFEYLTPISYFPNTFTNSEILRIASEQAHEENTSVIFSSPIQRLINKSKNQKLDEVKECHTLIRDIFFNIFIYTNDISGMINAQLVIPFLFSYEDQETVSIGTIGLPADRPSVITKEMYQVFENILDQINKVLPHIIPEISIQLKNYGMQVTDNGEEGNRVELVSSRGDKTFPFRCESDGIKKIVSILSALINTYNSSKTIVFIDELDSGIFEFLLGELLLVLSDGVNGQIIFTSHNLRPLEVLSDKKIVFTTTNKKNRYLRPKGIKTTNNLRDIYLRNVQLGIGEEYSLYSETNTSSIQKSFRKASKKNVLINNELGSLKEVKEYE